MIVLIACDPKNPGDSLGDISIPEQDKRYGIYIMNLADNTVTLIYSSNHSLHRVHENSDGAKLVFQQDFGGNAFTDSEICLVNTDGSGYRRITDNGWLDAYPSWSPDDSRILYLSWPDYPDSTMDIFMMDSSGQNPVMFYDSGFHDGDCHWESNKIVFTRQSRIWLMDENGGNTVQLTDFALAGQQGNANLPFGDYDPRLSPDASVICFDRMVDDQSASGNYDFYTITVNGTEETAITATGWQQFMAEWSHSGNKLLFTVAAKGGGGLYDMYTMSPDGSGLTNITPADWPPEFLCSHGIFSRADTHVYFVGEWWE